jgi:aspartate-semialdehyde dehydrogenase
MENGYTKEEMKMVWETKKIMGDDNILVNLNSPTPKECAVIGANKDMATKVLVRLRKTLSFHYSFPEYSQIYLLILA